MSRTNYLVMVFFSMMCIVIPPMLQFSPVRASVTSAMMNNTSGIELPISKIKTITETQPNISVAKVKPVISEHKNEIRVWYHAGGKELDYSHMYETTYAVASRMPNVVCNNSLIKLVMETYIVETRLGGSSYHHSAKNWHNYGLGQMRSDTAAYLLKTLKKSDNDVHTAVMKYYDRRLSLSDNLLKNVPFTIAMTIQYYKLRCPRLNENTRTLQQRARLWKKQWNTSAGVGTVTAYINRVTEYML